MRSSVRFIMSDFAVLRHVKIDLALTKLGIRSSSRSPIVIGNKSSDKSHFLKKIKPFPASFSLFSSFQYSWIEHTNLTDDWIRTADLCFRSDRSTNCATTTSQDESHFTLLNCASENASPFLTQTLSCSIFTTFICLSEF